MNKILLISLLFLVGCATTVQLNESIQIPSLNKEKSVGVGDVFFESSVMTGTYNEPTFVYNGNNFRFVLTVMKLTKDNIVLRYSEYIKPFKKEPEAISFSLYRGYDMTTFWKIKDGFSKEFEYELTNKFINYKDYEFEIISVGEGRIRYKRIK